MTAAKNKTISPEWKCDFDKITIENHRVIYIPGVQSQFAQITVLFNTHQVILLLFIITVY